MCGRRMNRSQFEGKIEHFFLLFGPGMYRPDKQKMLQGSPSIRAQSAVSEI